MGSYNFVNYIFKNKNIYRDSKSNVGQSNFSGKKNSRYVLFSNRIFWHRDFAKEIYIAIECFQKQFPPNSVGGNCCVSSHGLRAEIKP